MRTILVIAVAWAAVAIPVSFLLGRMFAMGSPDTPEPRLPRTRRARRPAIANTRLALMLVSVWVAIVIGGGLFAVRLS